MDNIEKNIARSIYWNYISALLIHGASLLAGIILTTLLKPADFGILALMYIVLGMGSVFIGQGYSTAIIREKEVDDIMLSTIFWINVSIGLIVVLLAYILGDWLGLYFEISQFREYLSVFSIAYLIQAINVVHLSLLKRKLDFRWHSILHIIATIIAIIVSIWLAYGGYEVYSLIWRGLASSIALTLLLWWYADWRPKFIFDYSSLKSIHRFSRAVFATRVIRYTVNQLDNFIVGKVLGASELGIYNRAKTFSLTPTREVHNKTKSVAYSALSKVENRLAYTDLLFKFVLLLHVVIVPLLLIVVISSDYLIYTYLSPEWYPLTDIIKVIGLASILISSGLPSQILMSRGASSELLRVELISNVIKAIILTAAFWYGSLYQIVLLFVISHFISILMINWVAYRHIQARVIHIMKYHILPAMMAYFVYLLNVASIQVLGEETWSSWVIRILVSLTLFLMLFFYLYRDIITSVYQSIQSNKYER